MLSFDTGPFSLNLRTIIIRLVADLITISISYLGPLSLGCPLLSLLFSLATGAFIIKTSDHHI